VANPTGQTYRYGEHAPRTEQGGPRIRTRDREWHEAGGSTGTAADRTQWLNQSFQPARPTRGQVTGLVNRYPVGSVLVALAAGFLTARCLAQLSRSL